jgi:hypothetical protein
MWRRLLRLAHPDGAGEHELFVWVRELHEHVAGDHIEDVRTSYQRRQPPPHPTAGERLDFTDAFTVAADFADLTASATALAADVGEPYARLLRMLASCYPVSEAETALYRAQHERRLQPRPRARREPGIRCAAR